MNTFHCFIGDFYSSQKKSAQIHRKQLCQTNSTAAYVGSHWVKLFFMNTLGKLTFSSRTTLLSICEQKDTSSKERSLQDSSNFLKDAGLTILVPVQKEKKRNETSCKVTENTIAFF